MAPAARAAGDQRRDVDPQPVRRQGLLCTTVQVSIKDPALKTIQRQMQLAAIVAEKQKIDALRIEVESGLAMATVAVVDSGEMAGSRHSASVRSPT